jgi:hypothetical protein
MTMTTEQDALAKQAYEGFAFAKRAEHLPWDMVDEATRSAWLKSAEYVRGHLYAWFVRLEDGVRVDIDEATADHKIKRGFVAVFDCAQVDLSLKRGIVDHDNRQLIVTVGSYRRTIEAARAWVRRETWPATVTVATELVEHKRREIVRDAQGNPEPKRNAKGEIVLTIQEREIVESREAVVRINAPVMGKDDKVVVMLDHEPMHTHVELLGLRDRIEAETLKRAGEALKRREPDALCITRDDGGCDGVGCMHDENPVPDVVKGERVEISVEAYTNVVSALETLEATAEPALSNHKDDGFRGIIKRQARYIRLLLEGMHPTVAQRTAYGD